MKKIVAPLIVGMIGVTTVGGHLLSKNFGESNKIMEQTGRDAQTFLMNAPLIKPLTKVDKNIEDPHIKEGLKKPIIAEYIFKTNQEWEKNKSCVRWGTENNSQISEEECKKLIEETWKLNSSGQPDIWFRADKESMEQVLKLYFPKSDKFSKTPLYQEWLEGDFKCIAEDPIKDENLEVSCSYNTRDISKSQNIN